MGIFDRLLGGAEPRNEQPPRRVDDDQAIARYRYMLKTAPPEAIEQTHAEAFSRLNPDQRRKVLSEISTELPEAERAAALRAGDDPLALARVATRAEVRQPGTLERTFGRMGGGMGFGGLMAGTFLSTMAGVVLGTAIAQSFLGNDMNAGGRDAGPDGGQDAGGYADSGSDLDGGDIGGFDV